MKRAATPGQAMIKALTELGLKHRGTYKDFCVRGMYRRSERDHTYVTFFSRHAPAIVIEKAKWVEARCSELGWTVRVRTTQPMPYDSNVHGQRVLDCRVDVSNR